jgi:hypothetical protein
MILLIVDAFPMAYLTLSQKIPARNELVFSMPEKFGDYRRASNLAI